MIHQYKLGGYNVVLDVCSGAVHVVDEVAYDIIGMYESHTQEEITARILEKYPNNPEVNEAELADCYSQIEELKAAGKLFTPDTFAPMAGKLKEKTSGVVKALFNADKAVFSETGTKMKNSITRRPKQVDKVFGDIESCPVESFVCGDFNDNPMSYTYFRMTRGRRDAFVEAGEGFGATYSRLWPLLRIDYVLVPDRFDPTGFVVPRVGYSDHYPAVAEIKF